MTKNKWSSLEFQTLLLLNRWRLNQLRTELIERQQQAAYKEDASNADCCCTDEKEGREDAGNVDRRLLDLNKKPRTGVLGSWPG